jgi:DNA-binding transcriptional MocR family regulator
MLQQGGYDAHLVKLRRILETQQAAAAASIGRHFPPGYRMVRPAGGYFLWIECAPAVDSLEVHRLALDSGITIAPGPMFSARRQFRNFIRLNYGHPWTAAMDQAVARLGSILRRY